MAVVESHREASVGWIVFNRPDVLNAINRQVMDVFASCMRDFVEDKDVRAIAITGTGRAFSTGADIGSLVGSDLDGRRRMMAAAHAMMASIETAPKPVIAAVNGLAAGGGFEIALACDFIFAEQRAQFGLTEIRYGFLPGGGGTQRLPHRIGWSQAMHLLCTGDMISAQRAADLGIVFRVVGDGEIRIAVGEFAGTFATRSPEAVAMAKALMRHALSRPPDVGLQAEIDANLHLLQTETATAAMAAFLDRRRQKEGKDR